MALGDSLSYARAGRRLALIAATLLAVTGSPVAADMPPPPGHVETCTLEARRLPGQECRVCGAYFGSRAECDQLGTQGYRSQCRSYGASVWREIWCRPADAAAAGRVVQLGPHGAMDGLAIPATWTWQRRDSGPTQYQWLYPPGRADVVVFSSFAAYPLDEAQARVVRRLLGEPGRGAVDVEDEATMAVLATTAGRSLVSFRQSFRPRAARAEDWNGRRALVVEGEHVREGERGHARYVDASGCGRLVQVVEYRAPAALYEHHVEAVMAILRTVRWGPLRTGACQ